MAAFKFFHTPKPKGFNYKPVFFDPEKEEREKRMKYSQGETSDSTHLADRMKDGYKRYRGTDRTKAVRKHNIRLSIILFILVLVTYFIFFN
jgi:hypothetical protein